MNRDRVKEGIRRNRRVEIERREGRERWKEKDNEE